MKDCVLWFVKVLLMMYVIFHIFVVSYLRNRAVGYLAMAMLTVASYCIVCALKAPSYALSVPFFCIGAILSVFKEKSSGFNLAIISVIAGSCLAVLIHQSLQASFLIIHTLFNYAFLIVFILIFSRYRIEICFPAIIGALSFDVYLIHYKVIYCLTPSNEDLHFPTFILLTSLGTISFYYFRTHLKRYAGYCNLWSRRIRS